MTKPKSTQLVSLPDAAARLGLHRATVNEMVRTERLRAERVGPHWFVDARELESFARNYKRPKNAPKRQPVAAQPSPDVMQLLADWGEATVGELAVVLDLHEGTIRKHLCIAEALGLASRDEFGRWTLTNSANQRAS